MSDLNKVLLIGRLANKPTAAETPEGQPMCRLDVVTSHSAEKEPLTHIVNVYGKQAERCVAQLDAGRLVYVEGVLVERGVVRATNVYFLGDKPGKKETP